MIVIQMHATGVWFTGVDFNIDALYQDQSKTNMAAHRVKVLINSSHFKDISVQARFKQDNRHITFTGQVRTCSLDKLYFNWYKTQILIHE
jgi:hypothetical protein